MPAGLCLACDRRPTNHDPVYDTLHIVLGEGMTGRLSPILRACNMIELVRAEITHTYAAARQMSKWQVCPVSCAMLIFVVFQICSSLPKKGGMSNFPYNLQFWQIVQLSL